MTNIIFGRTKNNISVTLKQNCVVIFPPWSLWTRCWHPPQVSGNDVGGDLIFGGVLAPNHVSSANSSCLNGWPVGKFPPFYQRVGDAMISVTIPSRHYDVVLTLSLEHTSVGQRVHNETPLRMCMVYKPCVRWSQYDLFSNTLLRFKPFITLLPTTIILNTLIYPMGYRLRKCYSKPTHISTLKALRSHRLFPNPPELHKSPIHLLSLNHPQVSRGFEGWGSFGGSFFLSPKPLLNQTTRSHQFQF